ncbi:hypothetical protein ROS217_01345 [Roseovarius sp. 217]|nr:hypothetical protein ROS217_01345 [Roseovarius sp. 217]
MIYFAALASGTVAQDVGASNSQSTLSYEQANMLTSGRGLTFPGLEDPAFVKGATFTLKHKDRPQTVLEFFEVRQDGKVCVDFGNISNRCGIFLKDDSLFFMLTKERDRFPLHLELNFD